MKRILIVEDEPTLCDAYLLMLNELQRKNKISVFKAFVHNTYQSAIVGINDMVNDRKVPDLCILDHRLNSVGSDKENGLELGIHLREQFPDCKIMFITSTAENFLFQIIIERIKPSAFLIKSDIDYLRTGEDIVSVLDGNLVYSKTVNHFTRNNQFSKFGMDSLELKVPEEELEDHLSKFRVKSYKDRQSKTNKAPKEQQQISASVNELKEIKKKYNPYLLLHLYPSIIPLETSARGTTHSAALRPSANSRHPTSH